MIHGAAGGKIGGAAVDATARRAHLGPIDAFFDAAPHAAQLGLAEGAIPIGSVLVIDGRIAGRGHNRRLQRGSAVLYAEMDRPERAGRLRAADYRRAALYSTPSPCDMCSGAILPYGIPRVVARENRTFRGPEAYPLERGVDLRVAADERCGRLMRDSIAARPAGAAVVIQDVDFVELLERRGPPPQVVWVTAGNVPTAGLRSLGVAAWPRCVALLRAGEPLVELGERR